MKRIKFFITGAFIFFLQIAFSQNEATAILVDAPVISNDWNETDHWMLTFQKTYGKTAATNWISELALNGTFYENKNFDGFIVVLPTFIHSNSQLQAKIKYGIFENKNTRLWPLTEKHENFKKLSTARFLGYLGGIPASLNLAVINENGKYLTIMGFHQGHELASHFAKNFEQMIERIYGEAVFAHR